MSARPTIDIADVTPETAFAVLSKSPNSLLVDCRTQAEWSTVGVPDLSGQGQEVIFTEWRRAPDMSINPDFESQLTMAIGERQPETIYFLCRSGARSKEAAMFFQSSLSSKGLACTCVNVATGFEGDPDGEGVRGRVNGWQSAGLPWGQNR